MIYILGYVDEIYKVRTSVANCSNVSETHFETAFRNSCNIVYKKSCKLEHNLSFNEKWTEVRGKCAIKYETKCLTQQIMQQKGKYLLIVRTFWWYMESLEYCQPKNETVCQTSYKATLKKICNTSYEKDCIKKYEVSVYKGHF